MREEGVLRADGGDGPASQPVPGTGAENSGPPTGANRPPIPGDDRLAARMARAERYLDDHLKKQRQWYSEKASAHKDWSQRLGLAVIVCGALVTFAQVFAGTLPLVIPAVTAALGAAVALLAGIQRIWKFDESWISYRRASEQMKREHRLYINNAGPYRTAADEEEAYQRFVENIEAIIAEEQQIYWKSRTDTERKDDGANNKPRPAEGGGQR
jgi:hypothetical protein